MPPEDESVFVGWLAARHQLGEAEQALRAAILETLATDHGHRHRRDGLSCRSCKGRASSVVNAMQGITDIDDAIVARWVKVLCVDHGHVTGQQRAGCGTCQRRAERIRARLLAHDHL